MKRYLVQHIYYTDLDDMVNTCCDKIFNDIDKAREYRDELVQKEFTEYWMTNDFTYSTIDYDDQEYVEFKGPEVWDVFVVKTIDD